MAASLATEPSSKRQTMVVAGAGLLLLAVATGAYIWANLPLGREPAFLPFYAGVVIVTELLTAYLLAAQFGISRVPSTLVLSCGYLYSGLIVIPHMLMFPGVVSDTGLFGAGPQSAIWMWVAWHGGFPLFVIAYAVVEWRQGTRLIAEQRLRGWSAAAQAGVVALVLGLAYLVAAHRDMLPSLVTATGSFVDLSRSTVGIGVEICNALAVLLVFAVTRGRTVGNLGLMLAIFASFLDAFVTLHSQARFSLGWYVARVNSVISAGSVLGVFLYELAWLYHKIADLNESLSRLAFLDELTGLANRRQFEERIRLEWERARRDRKIMSVIMIDVDHFKRYNDRYGHPAGDECLRQVARAIAATVRRPADLAARYGGEEFIVILPGIQAQGAFFVAKQIGEALRKLAIRHEAGVGTGLVTVSQGVAAMLPEPGQGWTSLTEAADGALYATKTGGRNGVTIATAMETAAPETAEDEPPAAVSAAGH